MWKLNSLSFQSPPPQPHPIPEAAQFLGYLRALYLPLVAHLSCGSSVLDLGTGKGERKRERGGGGFLPPSTCMRWVEAGWAQGSCQSQPRSTGMCLGCVNPELCWVTCGWWWDECLAQPWVVLLHHSSAPRRQFQSDLPFMHRKKWHKVFQRGMLIVCFLNIKVKDLKVPFHSKSLFSTHRDTLF